MNITEKTLKNIDFNSTWWKTNNVESIIAEGDCRTILKKIKSNSFDCLITDPAYRCISGGKGKCHGILSKNDGKIFKENNINFSEWLPDVYRILKENSHAYIFANFLNLQILMEEVQKVGFKIHNLLIWEKNNATPNRWYMKNCEYVLFCRKGKAISINNKSSKTVHKFNNFTSGKIHETEKPLDLISYYLLNSTKENDWILDPFGGSMVLNIAGLKHNRNVFSIEKDADYIEKGINRIRNFLIFNDERNIADVSIEDISLLSQKEEMSNEEEINSLYKQLFDEKSPLLTDKAFSKVPNKLNNTVISNKLNTTFNCKSHLNDNLKGNL